MWRDRESDEDFLNFTEVADQIATLALSPDLLPVSIGVFGTWGTGKSTVLKLAEAKMMAAEKPPIIIEFDAWLYQGFDDAKAALMEVVATRLLEATKDNESLFKKATLFAGRINYFRALGLAADFGVGMALGVPPGLLTRAGGAISAMVSGRGDAEDLGEVKEAGKAGKDAWSQLVKPEEAKTPPQEIAKFRKEFGELLQELDQTLVLFIDNLDRCLPDVAIGTLEAVRLFLFLPGTAFVIAADEDMIRHSVAKHFSDPNASHIHDYLDKVIQVPMRVPQVGIEDVRAYMYSLFVSRAAPGRLAEVQAHLLAALQGSWKGSTFTRDEVDDLAGNPAGLRDTLSVADRLAPILATAPNISGNPRIVKRLLNAVTLRQTLAASRQMTVDLATLAKLAVFERGTDAGAVQVLYRIVMDDNEKKEVLLPGDKGGVAELPPEWKRHQAFVDQWLAMEPIFEDPAVLRAAMFLSRDVMAPALARSGMSDTAREASAALMAINSATSPEGKAIAERLSGPDQVAVMGTIISKLREADWSDKVPGIHGAVLLGDASPEARKDLQAFVSTLSTKNMSKALLYLLRNKGYVEKK
jgi:predicted KAP-like P-loop ATPase